MVKLFSDDVVCFTPLTGELLGKLPTESVHRFRHRVRHVSEGAGAGRPSSIQWQEPAEEGEALTVKGSADSLGSIELRWVFNDDGQICGVSADGSPELVTQFLLGDEPRLL
jgi:hypothetical protein